MNPSVLDQIDETINYLSREEQLWLIEQLAHRLREGLMKSDIIEPSTFESQLVEMAADPEIRAELHMNGDENGFSINRRAGDDKKDSQGNCYKGASPDSCRD